MSYTIRFPHLHIVLNHVGQSINLWGYEVAFYGIIIAIGMILGVSMILREARRSNQSEDSYLDIAIWTIIFSVIGARLYYVVFAWDVYKDDLLSIFNIRQGGLAIYGGVLAGILTAWIISRIKKMNFLQIADTCILGLPIGQLIGRWGNFFNREAFGQYTDNLFAMQIPIDAVRQPESITSEMLSHVQTIDGVSYISVHPTFLYESLWNLGVFLILFLMRKHIKFRGQQFWTYLAAYGAGRFWIEGLRTDQLSLFGTGLPVSQLLAAVMVVIGVLAILIGLAYAKKHPLSEREQEEIAGKYAGQKTKQEAKEKSGSNKKSSNKKSSSKKNAKEDEKDPSNEGTETLRVDQVSNEGDEEGIPEELPDDGSVLTVDEVIRRTDERIKAEKEGEEILSQNVEKTTKE